MTDLGIDGLADATLIASGGSALVYAATAADGRRVAVKVLRGVRGNEVARRFAREQKAAELLQGHPAVIEILGTGLTNAGEPYLVMPLLEKGSLQDELERTGPFSVNQAVADVRTAAGAIWFAHSHGVLHRDVKPANLLRTNTGSVIVTDFGIARVVDSGISSATVGASTPLFAAPELLSDNEVSVASEVYSLGACLYALLAGRPAFGDTSNIWASINRIRVDVPEPIPGVPAPVMAVIHQSMAKDPSDRPADAGLFSSYLGAALTAEPDWRPPRPAPNTNHLAGTPTSAAGPTSSPAMNATPQHSSGLPASDAAIASPPRFDRPTHAIDSPAPNRRNRLLMNVIATVVALAAIAGLGWFALDSLSGDDPTDLAIENGLGDPTLPAPTTTGDANQLENDTTDPGSDPTPETTADPSSTSNSRVTFDGVWFTARLPTGWSVLSADEDVGYGFRSRFVADDMYLTIDTTPSERREPGGDIAESARSIASGIRSASAVTTETIDGLTMHLFTFTNRNGVPSIDIFFERNGDGYAVLAGSSTDPEAIYAIARQVALSVRST